MRGSVFFQLVYVYTQATFDLRMELYSSLSEEESSESESSSSESSDKSDFDEAVEFNTPRKKRYSKTTSAARHSELQKTGSAYETPRKKQYRRSIKHGFSSKRARYHSHDAVTNVESADFGTNLLSQNVNQIAFLEHQSLEKSSDSNSSFTNSELSNSGTESDDTTSLSEWSSSGESTCDTSFSSSYEQKDDHPDEAHEHIYEGCHHSLLTSYTMVMLFVMKHSLSKEAFADLLLLIATHLPVSSTYSKSIYKLKEFLKGFIKIKEPKVHNMCENCQQLLDGESCPSIQCRLRNAKTLKFHDLHLKDQLRELFQGLYCI